MSAVEAAPGPATEGGHARGSEAAPGGREDERTGDLLAGERVWEAAWGEWATARASADDSGAGG